MAILANESTPPGTHPSYATSHTLVECDECGTCFDADCRVDGKWMFHGKAVGLTDYSGGEDEDLCAECEAERFAED